MNLVIQNVLLSAYYAPETCFLVQEYTFENTQIYVAIKYTLCYLENQAGSGDRVLGVKRGHGGAVILEGISKLRPLRRGFFWTNVCSLSQMPTLLI